MRKINHIDTWHELTKNSLKTMFLYVLKNHVFKTII